MAKPLDVLIVEDSESDAQLIVRLLRKSDYKVVYEQVDTAEGMLAALEKRTWDIVISDYSLPQFNGEAALALVRERGQDIPFIVVSGTMGEETAVAMMKAGAQDYLVKGDLTRLVPAIERELEQAVVRSERRRAQEELQASEKRFRALIENSSDAITLLDASGKVIYDSPSAPGMLGYGPDEWIGKLAFSLMHPDDQHKNQEIFQDLQKTPGKSVPTVFRVRHKRGSWLWIEATATNLLEEPTVKAVVLNYRDITQRVESDEVLRASEERFRLIFDTSLDGILLIAPDGSILAANRSACRIFDRTEEELKQVQRGEIFEIFDPRIAKALEDQSEKGSFFGELTLIRRDGKKVSAEVSTSLFKDKDGSLKTSMIIRDITGRKRREEQLAESEARYKRLFDNSGTSILIIDKDGKYLQANKKAAENFGCSVRDVEGKSIFDILPAQTAQKYLKNYRSLIKTGGHREYEDVFPLLGVQRTFLIVDQCLQDASGQNYAVQSSAIDVTERKKAEEALHESEQKFQSLVEQSPDGISIVDDDGKILDWNKSDEQITGLARAEVLGKPLWNVLEKMFPHPENVPAAQSEMEARIRDYLLSGYSAGWDKPVVAVMQHPDGVTRTVELSIFKFTAEGRSMGGSVIRDITERKQAEEALRESESIFRGFLEQSEDAIMLADEQGEVIQWSKGAEKLTGYARKESLGKFLWDVQYRSAPDEFKSPEHHELIRASLQTVLKTGQGLELNQLVEAVIQRRDGTRATAQTSAFSIHTDKGYILGSILRDITERKQAEETIRLSEQRYRTLYENNNLGLYRTTPDGEILLANPALVRMLGFNSFDELKNKNLEQDWFQPSFPRTQFLELIEKHGQVQGLETAWERQDGSFIFVSESSRAIRDPEGKTLYYDGTVEDITERKQAEDKLRISEKRFSGAFEYAAIGMALVATDGLMLRVNLALCELLGYQKEELLEKTFQDITYPGDLQADQAYLQELLAGKIQSYQIEKRFFHRSGQTVWVLLNESLIRDDRGEPLYLITQIENITERKQAEEALRESETRYKGLFEDSPISLWEEDYSAVKQRLDALRAEGITDFEEYFTSHPEVVAECATLIKVLDVNQATMRMFGAKHKEDMLKSLSELFEDQPPQAFQDELITIAESKTRLDWQGTNKTLDGRLIDIEMSWSIAPGYEDTLSKVIVSLVDTTERKQAEAALAKSEQDYRTLFENMPIGLYRTAADGRLLDANQAMVNMFGYRDREALLAENVVELYLDPASDQKFKSEIEKTGVVSNFEAEFKRPDGSTFWTEDHNHIIRAEDGTPLFYEGSLIDITERKQAEDMLVAERDLLTTLINTLPDNIFIKDITGRILINNHAHQHTLGASTLEQVMGKTDFDFFPGEMAAQYDADEKQVIRSGEALINKEEPLIDQDNNQRWLLTTKVPLRDRRGNITGIVGFNHDITERKQAEDLLLAERDLLTTLINTLPDSIFIKDVLGRVVMDNHAHQRTLRATTLEQVVGKTDFDFHPRELAAQYDADEKRVIQSGEPMIDKMEPFINPENDRRWLLTTKVPLRDRHGNITGIVGFNHDITERKQSEERIQRHLQRLAALRAIDQVVTSSFDLHNSLAMILKRVTDELGVDAADVLMLNPVSIQLDYSGGVGFRTKGAEKSSMHLGHGYAGRVALERQLIRVANLKDQPPDLQLRAQLAGEDFVSYFGVPLMAKGGIKGVLEIFHRSPIEPDQEWLDFLNTAAGQIALAIDNTNLFDSLQRSNIDLTLAYDATIEGWSHAMDLRDKETEGHTLRVTEITMELAGLFGIKDEDMVGIRRGALLHDIGKMGVPDAILLKPAKLTDEEWLVMRKHPSLAFEMLSPIRYLQSAMDIPYCHHEKWDGTGYPRGLKGEQIPLSARIFAIADVWDALTSDRPYRNAWSNEKTLEYLRSEAGKHFDPQVLKTCLEAGVFDRKKRS